MKKYTFLLFIPLLCGCDPVLIERDLPDGSQKICINSFFYTDSTWLVNITRGKNILSPHPYSFFAGWEKIDNASVAISENGQHLATLELHPTGVIRNNISGGSWYQTSNAVSQAGKTYEINVSAPGFENISATCHIPAAVPISRVDPIFQAPDENWRIPIEIHFTDPPESSNYYEILIRITIKKIKFHVHGWEDWHEIFEIPVLTEDPLFYFTPDSFDPLDASSKQAAIFFSDKGMSGKNIKIRGAALTNALPANEIEADYDVILRSVSEDYYKYRTTKAFQQTSKNDPFAQPTQIYSNVQNGLGIFAGASSYAFPIDF